MLGDYQRNNDVQYSEQVVPVKLPAEVDYDVIRRGFWESSDMMYKYSLGMMAQKANFLQQNPQSPEMAAGNAATTSRYPYTRTDNEVRD